MKRIFALLFALLLLTLIGCVEEKPSRVVEGSVEYNKENYPKICVTPYTLDIAVNMTKAVLSVDENEALAEITVCDTTNDCYIKLIKGECDIVFAHDYGKMVENQLNSTALKLTSTELKEDALVFVNNGLNGVDSLSVETLKKVFGGEVKNWKDIGGKDLPIVPFGARLNSAADNAFKKYILADIEIPKVFKTIATDKGELQAEVSYDNRDGAIGYTLLSVGGHFSGGSIKPLAIDNILPNSETVESNQYPFLVSVSAVIRSTEAANSDTKILYNWIFSEQGKAIIG